MRVPLQRLLHRQRKTVHAAPHVGGAGGQPHPHAGRDEDHSSSTPRTRRSANAPHRARHAPSSRPQAWSRSGRHDRQQSGEALASSPSRCMPSRPSPPQPCRPPPRCCRSARSRRRRRRRGGRVGTIAKAALPAPGSLGMVWAAVQTAVARVRDTRDAAAESVTAATSGRSCRCGRPERQPDWSAAWQRCGNQLLKPRANPERFNHLAFGPAP